MTFCWQSFEPSLLCGPIDSDKDDRLTRVLDLSFHKTFWAPGDYPVYYKNGSNEVRVDDHRFASHVVDVSTTNNNRDEVALQYYVSMAKVCRGMTEEYPFDKEKVIVRQ